MIKTKPTKPSEQSADAAARMTTAEATVAALIAHGIDTIYALPGVHNDHLFDALFKAATASAPSIPGMSRARPTWRSAPRSRPASRRPMRSCPDRACSIPRPRCSPPTA